MRITLVHLLSLISVVKTQCSLSPRATQSEANTTCSGDAAASVFTRFTGIFFGDFTLTGGQDILGPLAVGGTFTANSYTVNSNHGTGSCSDPTADMSTYGLVVGGEFIGSDVHVHGSAFLPGGTDTDAIEILDTDCEVYTDKGTGLFDFDQAYKNAVNLQKVYAGLSPTMQLNSDATLTKLSDPVLDFNVFTFDTCLNGCTVNADSLSDPEAFLLGKGNWNGVPVTVGSSITLINNQPTAGIDPCRTIWNFYPVDSEGNYSPGKIEINRQTAGQLGGLILAPNADIVDGSTGNFAGLTIADNYMWGGAGVEMHDYSAIGGQCSGFIPCIPIYNNTPPDDPNNPPSSSSSSYITSSTSHETDSSSDSTDSESSSPSTNSDSDSTPPIDSSSESTPPIDSSSDSTPPVDSSSESTPPIDSSSDSTPPIDSSSESTSHTGSVCTPTSTMSESICTKHASTSEAYIESTLSPTYSTITSPSFCSTPPLSTDIQSEHDSHHNSGHHKKVTPTQGNRSHRPLIHHHNDKNQKNKYKNDNLDYNLEWDSDRNVDFNMDNCDDDRNYKYHHENDYKNEHNGKKKHQSGGSKHDETHKKNSDHGNKGHGNGEYNDGDKMKNKYQGQSYQDFSLDLAKQSWTSVDEPPASSAIVDTPIADQVPKALDSKITSNSASKSSSLSTMTKTTSEGSINGLHGLETLLLISLVSIFSTFIF